MLYKIKKNSSRSKELFAEKHQVDPEVFVYAVDVEKPQASLRRFRNPFAARCKLENCMAESIQPDLKEHPSQVMTVCNVDLSNTCLQSESASQLYSQFLNILFFESSPIAYTVHKYTKAATFRLHFRITDVLTHVKTFFICAMIGKIYEITRQMPMFFCSIFTGFLNVNQLESQHTKNNKRTLLDKTKNTHQISKILALFKERIFEVAEIRKFVSDKVVCTLFKVLSRIDSKKAVFVLPHCMDSCKIPAKSSQGLFIQF